MPVEFTVTGHGAVGDIQPDWSVEEEATPVTIGDRNGSVGQVSLSAQALHESELAISKASTFEHDRMGSISGRVDSVSPVPGHSVEGGTVSLTTDTPLARLNVDRDMPASMLSGGSPINFGTLSIPAGFNVEVPSSSGGPPNFWEVGGVVDTVYHSDIGPDGLLYVLGTTDNPNSLDLVIVFDPMESYRFITAWWNGGELSPLDWGGGVYIHVNANYVYVADATQVVYFDHDGTYNGTWGGAGSGDGQFAATRFIASSDSGDIFMGDLQAVRRIQRFTSDGTYLNQWDEAHITDGLTISDFFGLEWVSSALYICYRGAESPGLARMTSSGTASVLIGPGPLGTVIDPYGVLPQNPTFWTSMSSSPGTPTGLSSLRTGATLTVFQADGTALRFSPDWLILNESPLVFQARFNYVDTMQYGGYTPGSQSQSPSGYYVSIDTSTSVGSVVTVSGSPDTLSSLFVTYLASAGAQSMSYEASNDPYVFAPPWSGNVWTMVKDLCAAYSVELTPGLTVRDVGSRSLGISDVIAGSFSMGLDALTPSSSVNISYQNYRRGHGVFYDALAEQRVFTLEPGETVRETLLTSNYPYILLQPPYIETFPSVFQDIGGYTASGSDGLPITAGAWVAYGGSLSVSPSVETPGGIDIVINAPSEIPGVPGPYSLAVSYGQNTYPTLDIRGYGLFSSPQSLRLLTGTDPALVSQNEGSDIDNIFIADKEMAYDRGVWASVSAAGPRISITGSVATEEVERFGSEPGSLVEFNDSVYRVVGLGIGIGATGLTLSRHVTVGDFDAVWDGEDVGDHDAFWDTYVASDQNVLPLRH